MDRRVGKATCAPWLNERRRKRAHHHVRVVEWWARRKSAFAHPTHLDRHCKRSEAIPPTATRKNGLLRRFAPRSHGRSREAMLTSYFAPGASSFAVHIAFHEIGTAFEARPMSFKNNGLRSPD